MPCTKPNRDRQEADLEPRASKISHRSLTN